LRKGDCSWGTIKLILGWIIDTSTMNIHLPQHRQERLAEILTSILPTQKRIGIKKWHKILGEIRSMSIALPGSRYRWGGSQLLTFLPEKTTPPHQSFGVTSGLMILSTVLSLTKIRQELSRILIYNLRVSSFISKLWRKLLISANVLFFPTLIIWEPSFGNDKAAPLQTKCLPSSSVVSASTKVPRHDYIPGLSKPI